MEIRLLIALSSEQHAPPGVNSISHTRDHFLKIHGQARGWVRKWTAGLFSFQLRHRFCGVADYVEHNFGMRELRNMNGAVLSGHDGPTRLRPPCEAIELLCEQISGRREMGGPNYALLLRSQVAREVGEALRQLLET